MIPITLLAQLTGDAVKLAYRQTEGKMSHAACRILGQVIMEHALARNWLDEFKEGTSVIGLRGQPFAGYGLAAVGQAQIPSADIFRLGKASNGQSVGKELYGGMNIRDYPADLGQFKFGDGVIDTVHICLPLALWQNKVKAGWFLA